MIESKGGNVTLIVTDGDLLDRNSSQELDTRTYEELKALWDAMNLTGSLAEDALAEAIAAYTSSRESEYETYWLYRSMQTDPGVYDPDFIVPVSEEEASVYKNQLGLADSLEAIIETLSEKRTDEYHALHRIYGVLGDSHASDWSYPASAAYEPSFNSSDVDSDNDTILLGTHILTDKQAVSLRCESGSSIGNLLCGDSSSVDQQIYYVKLDATSSGLIKLAASLDDWTAGIYIDLGEATGSFQLSEITAMTSGYKWTENQLRYTLNAGWLKETSDTQTAIEEANIIAQGSVSVTANNGNIGSDEGVEVIDLSGGVYKLTDDQRVMLAATERRDAIIIDADLDIISLGVAHNFSAGDLINLPGMWNLDPATIPGLPSSKKIYYAILVYNEGEVDPYSFKLAASYSDAVAGTPIAVDLTQEQIRINLKDDFDIDADGGLTVHADGFAYIGSEENIMATDIRANGELRVKTGKKITADPSASGAVISGCLTSDSACSVILEAGGASIGTLNNPVTTNIPAPYGSLIARAGNNIFIEQVSGDLLIDVIYAPNLVNLNASAGSLLDAFDDENLNIKTGDLVLNALNDVGELTNLLEIDLPNNTPADTIECSECLSIRAAWQHVRQQHNG